MWLDARPWLSRDVSRGLLPRSSGGTRARRVAWVAALGAVVCFTAPPASAQFGSIAPPFAKLTGGYLWGSLGFSDVEHPERFHMNDAHPFVRGGFAIMLGPFGGQPDTIVTLDSVRTSVEWQQVTTVGSLQTRADTIRTVRTLRSHHTLPGRDGWVSLALGYEYAGAYRVDIHDDNGTLASTFPVGGFYMSAFFGPFPVWHMSRYTFWYVTLGAIDAQLKGANGTSNGTLVRFDTESTVAPEAALLLGWRAHRGLRVIGGISAQHIRWSSIHYSSPSDTPLTEDQLKQLPDGLRLTSVHLNLGLSFDASDLFGK